MSGHLGDSLTALVDGELDHADRERVLGHLAHCAPCRTEVEAHRRFKASLTALRATPAEVAPDLTARLLAVAASPPAPAVPPTTPRAPRGPRGAARPLSRARVLRSRARRPRRSAAAGVLVVAGLVGALALGSPAGGGPAARVDPASPELLVDHISSTSEVPLLQPAFASVVPAGAAADPDR